MKFILTNELGRLAKWLRILGFDAIYSRSKNYPELIIDSLREERIILTRDNKLSPAGGIRLIRIREDGVREQLRQVLDELRIHIEEKSLFTMCVICDIRLVHVEKAKINGKVPEYVYKTQEDFVICPKCKRAYWQGTHWGNVRKLLDSVVKAQDEN